MIAAKVRYRDRSLFLSTKSYCFISQFRVCVLVRSTALDLHELVDNLNLLLQFARILSDTLQVIYLRIFSYEHYYCEVSNIDRHVTPINFQSSQQMTNAEHESCHDMKLHAIQPSYINANRVSE